MQLTAGSKEPPHQQASTAAAARSWAAGCLLWVSLAQRCGATQALRRCGACCGCCPWAACLLPEPPVLCEAPLQHLYASTTQSQGTTAGIASDVTEKTLVPGRC